MVSLTCIAAVSDTFTKLGIPVLSVELGRVEIDDIIPTGKYQQLESALAESGFEILHDKKSIFVQKIKTTIMDLVNSEQPMDANLSQYLSRQLNYDYTYLANIFSATQGSTIEKFIISYKIERVKQLLTYSEWSLTEIAYRMHYSSVAHLSSQFKKVTGMNPSHFKQLSDKTHKS